jgi:hypothetical protein
MKKTKQILKLLEELFGDTTVSQQETLGELREIQSDLEMKIGCIEADLERDAG